MYNKIIIICPYFGKLPSYFNLWLKSCKFNKNIDFLVITDDKTEFNFPQNVKIELMEFNSFTNLISTKLNIEINVNRPYKLCDFRPAYGIILDDYIIGYEFWGHCDLDMIFGDISEFITEDILKQYNKILCRGHLSLYRNNNIVNNYFKLDHPEINYKNIFNSNKNFAFDEWAGIHKLLTHHNIEVYHDEFIADIDPKFKKLLCTKIPNYNKQIFVWHKGKVYQYYEVDGKINKREVAYIHFQKRNMNILTEIQDKDDTFIITPDGFQKVNISKIDKKKLELYNKDSCVYRIKYLLKIVKKKIDCII